VTKSAAGARRTQLSYVVHCGTFASQVCDLLDPGGPATDV